MLSEQDRQDRFILYTPQTWAYINAQLDFPFSRTVRIHIVDEWKSPNKTLCGIRAHGGEFDDSNILPNYDHNGIWDCKKCKYSWEKIQGRR